MSKISYIKSIDNSKQTINFKRAFKGTLTAIFFNLLLLLLFAVIITYSDVNIEYAKVIGKGIFYTGAFLSGLFSSIGIKNNGWFEGMFSGIIYSITILLFSMLITENFNLQFSLIITLIISVFFAIIGGVVGINIRIKKKKTV